MNIANIVGAVGLNGAGKGLLAARLACSTWATGGVVVANIGLTPEAAGFPGAPWYPLRQWRHLPQLGVIRCTPGEDCDDHAVPTSHPERSMTLGRPVLLWLDEIQSVFPARQFASMPPELVRMVNQLRKQRVGVVWTTPAWAQCDIELRRVTRQVVECTSYLADPWERERSTGFLPPVVRRDGRRVRARGSWAPRRLFRFRAYDAINYDIAQAAALSSQLARRVKPQWTSYYWRQRHLHQFAYSSDAQVQLLDHLDHAGICTTCDGSRSRPKCRCDAAGSADRRAGGSAPPPQRLGSSR